MMRILKTGEVHENRLTIFDACNWRDTMRMVGELGANTQSATLLQLNQDYQTRKDDFPDAFRLRIHRALSWLVKAQQLQEVEDLDMQFIALWIAFNSAYAKELGHTSTCSDRSTFRDFLNLICQLDKEKLLYALVWTKFSSSIRLLLDNQFVFQPFWDFHNGLINEQTWLDEFDKAKKRAQTALIKQDTDTILAIVFDRLYTLRNQMMHGGSTYASSANRKQLKDECTFLSEVLVLLLAVMMNQPEHQAWGKPFYPYIKN